MGRHVKSLEFFDVLLGDRPALSDVNRFYQRTLANDPDEALDQAEKMLAERSLVDYYDAVVLPALKLAAYDEARGTISRERAAEMTRSIVAVINDLDEHVDKRTAVVTTEQPVHTTPPGLIACVAGRGPFDEAVTAMLAQLLAQRGVAARRIPYGFVSRELIAQLDVNIVQVVSISCLELAGAPAHLRYLIRRIRHRAPTATFIAGLWSEGETALKDPEVQKALGADRYVTSLRDALDACLTSLSERRARPQGPAGLEKSNAPQTETVLAAPTPD
jgi:hypothetical protein